MFLLGFKAVVRYGRCSCCKKGCQRYLFPFCLRTLRGHKKVFEGVLNSVQEGARDHFLGVTKMVVKVLKFGFRVTLRVTFRVTKKCV